MSDPTGAGGAPSVVVRGGADPTRVETETVTAQARVLLGAADAVAAAVEGWRLARVAVGDTSPWTVAAGPTGSPGFPSPLGDAPVPTTWWSAEVVRARQALLDELDHVVDRGARHERALRDLGERMLQAVAVYDDAETAAAAVVGEIDVAARTAVLSRGLGGGPVGVLLATSAELLWRGLAGFAGAAASGEGIAPARLLTSTEDRHAPTVTWLSRWLGLLDPRREPGAAPTVGNAAWVLGLPYRAARSHWAPEPVVTRRGTPPGAALPDAVDVRTALDAVDALYDTGHLPGSVLSIQRIDKGDGLPPTWLMAVPGTQLGQDRTVFGMTSNLALMDAGPAVRARADGVRAVLAAMEDAQIRPGDDVVLVGHSQGGMIASTVAAAAVGTFSVRHVVTAGSPVAGHPLPPGTRGTHLETQGEGVSDLDGAENVATRDRVTVTGRFPAVGGLPTLPHGVAFHQAVLAAADAVGDRGLAENLTDVETLLSGRHDEPVLYEARLVRPVDRTVAQAVPGSAGPFAGPFGDPFTDVFRPGGPGWDRGRLPGTPAAEPPAAGPPATERPAAGPPAAGER
ncbi:PGAP1-like alpha/beta domain-containing protein [Cellulosimicrobium sp. Marseille-Q8652]